MFCYQCEQTAKGSGCEVGGVCGKSSEVATLQDILLYSLMGLSSVALESRKVGISDPDIDSFTVKSVFATLTNVNFDNERLLKLIKKATNYRISLLEKGTQAGAVFSGNNNLLNFFPSSDMDKLIKQGEEVGLKSYPSLDENILSLKHTVLFGIKGVSAYADHAQILGQKDESIYEYVHKGLTSIQKSDLSLNDWIGLTLECGKIAFRAMELLDKGNTSYYGHPIPTKVPLGQKKGKAILVSGHDLLDLELLLKQISGTEINVYTHGEMLPSHAYPKLKKYSNFYGHYGTAWQNQRKEFSNFPGAILMTTNCIQRPKNIYKENIFTSGMTGWSGITHIDNSDFQMVINKALELPGFSQDKDAGEVNVGFARNTVMSVADKVVEAVKNGSIKHIFLVGGCDGVKSERSYYSELVNKIPEDCIILTLGCAKYRFFDNDFGSIDGIPRLLDVGQCNDAYSAVQITIALAKATNLDINDLPLSLILSWYEQKAVCVLLALLYLGVKNIRLGPTLPAFITPGVFDVLIKNFNLMSISTPEKDISDILG